MVKGKITSNHVTQGRIWNICCDKPIFCVHFSHLARPKTALQKKKRKKKKDRNLRWTNPAKMFTYSHARVSHFPAFFSEFGFHLSAPHMKTNHRPAYLRQQKSFHSDWACQHINNYYNTASVGFLSFIPQTVITWDYCLFLFIQSYPEDPATHAM